MSEISTLSPAIVWAQFDAITKVPRPSKREEKIIEWLIGFAKEHNLEYKRDKIGNVVIKAAATEGYEQRPIIILQSHVDMVCEKNSEVEFDFDKDAIRTRIVDGWVKADGTTLGADCGIGMAAALAVLIDPSVEHGPIEALFTVDEETGLTGAFELAEGMIEGAHLINLDSEDEGELFIGCAGGIDTVATFTYQSVASPANYIFYRVDVSDLQGGHSGDDISKGRVNSNKTVARLLWEGASSFDLRLCYFDGGNLRNAIPREAYAIFGVPKSLHDQFIERYNLFAADMHSEFRLREPNFKISLNEMPHIDTMIDLESQTALINALVGLPNGVIAMSQAVEGLVETSTNLASVKFEGCDKIVVTTSQRSSVESAKTYAMQMVESVFTLAGADVTHSDGYPGWAPNPDSDLLRLSAESYESLFGQQPLVKAIHAGLECGLFLEKYPQLDMISFGPTLRGVHSPDERLEIASVDKFWRLLCDLLKRI
ncbi:MAG: aminoacyl-histidine dipeptidase [Rikenellaceae bacterium]